ncbi:hypothetical protein PFICI_10795 [Pestalotiopsis fici W106-1]|uniref:carboxypeptidase C n=1 Tax=Pestalotiopsis fici (strain W106-1 / CGMCC3.15140) TaxID=1229662 RepID=W3WVP7_PESFW|nr:uncharacterized protein PFICI_10795 [Pestalotiopsis fici W106-1]ETS76921.1 hypothetical protein PFICI_10795 [Pestalotiopsis fici W106-1]
MFSSLTALALLSYATPFAVAWDAQRVLSAQHLETEASATGDNWSVREQYDSTCVAGSRHFAGQINVTDDKSMFFWFVESRESPNDRPVVIWLSGGPGASSLVGLFNEVGPCSINEHSNATFSNHDSWTNHANMLFIDQPVGVGLSLLQNGSKYPSNLEESSPDFTQMLKIWYGEIFPQFGKVPLYIAGESFGGRYVPRYAADIVRQKQTWSAGPLQSIELGGLILVNALVDSNPLSTGHYDVFCTDQPPNLVRFNETTCRAMGAAVPECERLASICQRTLDPQVCLTAQTFCMENLEKYFYAEVEAHRLSPYDLRRNCPEPPLCGVGVDTENNTGSPTDYVNRSGFQQELGFRTLLDFRSINFDLNTQWALDPRISVPTTSDLTYLLNGGVSQPRDKVDPSSVVPVLVLNGEYDVTCNQPGIIREYDNLPWHRHAAYRAEKAFRTWTWTDRAGKTHQGGVWKGTPQREKGLEFVSVKDAGHMSPADQRGAVTSIFGRWLANGGLLRVQDLS